MFSIFIVVIVLTSVPGRMTDPLGKSLEILENAVDSDPNKLKSISAEINNLTRDCSEENNIYSYETAFKLTPYIKEGLLQQARDASEVNSTMFLGHKSYSGYLTVDEQYNSNTFFWYFPVEGKPVEETPWIIWLQGEPGASSLFGLFHEIGPFTVDNDGILHHNPYTWLRDHSLVFIDNPIGVGFSFTDHKDGYATNMENYSAHLYSATRQLLTLFPELQRAPLYVAGESYAGKYAPSLALELHRHKDEIKVNLQGVILGNAMTEPHVSLSVEPWLFFGTLDASEARELQPRIDDYYRDIAAGKHAVATTKLFEIASYVGKHSYQDSPYNYLHDENPMLNIASIEFLGKELVMKALHVGRKRFLNFNYDVYNTMSSESSNVQPKIEALLQNYQVLAYCGNLDQMFPCPIAAENHRKWNWKGLKEFVKAPRQAFRFYGEVEGYFKTGGRFTEVVLIGAGHVTPVDKPAEIQDLIAKWTHGKFLDVTSVWRFYINTILNNVLSFVKQTPTNKLTHETQDQTTQSPTRETLTTETEINNGVERKLVKENSAKEIGKTQALDNEYLNSKNNTTNEIEKQKTEDKVSSDITDDIQAERSTTKLAATKQLSVEEDPLILTTYLKEGLVDQARNASEVNSTIFLGYKSYSGFFTVNETYNSNTFFWYFPVESKPVEETPWIIWLQGGPGASSLFGLTSEIGPFTGARDGLKKNPNSWLHNHSLVFIDNPVGTGFSFTAHEDGYAKDMETYSAHLYSATRQLLTLFPELQRAPLYVAGESYGGKYAPSLALELHRHKAELQVNLQGVMVGNGYIDPAMLSNFTRSFYNFGLLSPEDVAELREYEMLFDRAVLANRSTDADYIWQTLLVKILKKTQLKQAYNFLHSRSLGEDLMGCKAVLQDKDIAGAIHVGGIRNNVFNATVSTLLKPEFLTSAKAKYEELMEHYRVLLYCGQLDQMLSCGVASEFHLTFKWSGHDAFVAAGKASFNFNNSLAVYHKTGGNLTEAVVRGAGHMAPADQGAPLRDFVTRWTHRLPPFPF